MELLKRASAWYEVGVVVWGHGACAVHPDRHGAITCKHCGSYACSECTIDKLWGETLCAACDERGVASYRIAWDRALSPSAFVVTCRAVFADLRLVFSAFPVGSVPRAFGFAALTGAMLSIAIVVIGLAQRSSEIGTVLTFIATSIALFVVTCGFAFWACQRLLGGYATLAMCLRASAYLSALDLISITTVLMPAILAIVIFAGTTSLHLWAWKLLGVGRARLTPLRAWISALTAFVVGAGSTVIFAAIIAVIYGAASGELDLSKRGE